MREPDMQKLDALMGRMLGDVGAAVSGAMVLLGDNLGLFKAMADGEPMTTAELAAKAGIKERYVREWLSAVAAADYVAYDEATASGAGDGLRRGEQPDFSRGRL
jgi:hypothetical protein